MRNRLVCLMVAFAAVLAILVRCARSGWSAASDGESPGGACP